MPRTHEGSPSPERESNAQELAARFFELLKERGDLRRSLRSKATVGEEEVLSLREGKAADILAVLQSRRKQSPDDREKPAQRLTRRLETDDEAQQRLSELDREIKALIQTADVSEAIERVQNEHVEVSRAFRNVQDELRALQDIEDELDAQDYAILRGKKKTALDRKTLEGNAVVRAEVERRLRVLEESPETARSTRIAELLSYRESLEQDRYAMTPSRRELAEQIQTLWARGEAVLLTGSTGTGKTELFSYLTKKLYGRPLSHLVRSTQNTTPAEIFGMMGLVSKEGGGTDTVFKPGVYVQAIDDGTPFILDEFNLLETKIRFGLKELYNRRPGDEVKIQEDSGLAHIIQDGFVIGATANIKGTKHKERFELDSAEARVFASRKVDYLPKEETYDLILATLMDRRGMRLSREDASETLKHLLEAAELIQQAYEGRQTQFYAEGGGAKKTPAVLEKAVLDQGRILKIISGWPVADARGQTFRDFLEDELLHIIRTEDYPEKDRRLLLQIFVTKGFFNRQSVQDMDVPGVDEKKLEAWGWKHTDMPGAQTEMLMPAQVADLDPFGLRKLRAGESADEFLGVGEGSEDARGALAALSGMDLAGLPDGIREKLAHEALPPGRGELLPFVFDTAKAKEYGFSEMKIEAHPKAQAIVDAVYARDSRFVTTHPIGSPDPDSTTNPKVALIADKYKLNESVLKTFWRQDCPDLPNTPEKSLWYFQALAEHRLSNTIDGDNPNNLTNPSVPLITGFGQKAFMLAMDFKEFDWNDTQEKANALTAQTKKILKTLFNTKDLTSITRDEVNTALWRDHDARIQSSKAKAVISTLLGSSANPDDYELRLMRPDEYQRASQTQGYGQKNLWTHFDGYHAHDDGPRYGLVGGFRGNGGAADVADDHRGVRRDSLAVRLVLSRKSSKFPLTFK
ncbi:MAG: AAA family ATPase [Patescibacteria group bacterium]